MMPTFLRALNAAVRFAATFVTFCVGAATLTFHTNAPTPGASDICNFDGGARDGLNVNDANGLDGELNDAFTYVARDRVNQGQSFTTGSNPEGYLLKAIWVRHVGYTTNGQAGNTEPNYNGTWWDFSGGGAFTVRVTDPAAAGSGGFALRSENFSLTGGEANNPGVRPNGGTTDNGTGRWLRFELSSPVSLAAGKTYGFDVISNGGANRFFEWLGSSNSSAFVGGTAYQGGTTGQSGGPDNALNVLNGDRVFLVELADFARPTLSIELASASQTSITWPVGQLSFLLESSLSINGPWDYAGLPVSVQNSTNMATGDILGAARFYRLRMSSGENLIPVQSVQQDADGATLQMNPGTMRLQVFSPRVIRVAYSPTNSIPTNSLAVIAASTNSGWTLLQTATEVRLTTTQLEVRVNRGTGAVGFYDTNGLPLLTEKSGGGKALTPAVVGGFNTLQSRQTFDLPPGEAIFGLGQHQSGVMNYRGTTVRLQQQNPGESGIPVMVSSRGYGLLWDNPAITDVDVGQTSATNLTWTSEAADAIDYYFMYGPELDDVIAGYRKLTGDAPMFGKWAWGLWQCKNAYETQQELIDVVTTYRTNNIPLDGIIQDWQWWWDNQNTSVGNAWGSHIFYAPDYPDPTNLMTTLHNLNAHAIISVWPRFDVGIEHANELTAVGGLFTNVLNNVWPPGQGQWYDPFNAAARQVYWSQMSEHIFSTGFDGWWFDASEGEFGGNWGQFRSYNTAAGPGAKVFNAYPLMHTKTAYDGQRAETSSKRVFILTRSAYAGQQRHAAVTWSGDIGSSWSVFANQIPAGLNFAASGVPYWNTDTGGFNDGAANNASYAEVFTRWFQFSTFCPMLRIHGNNAKEIWRFPAGTQTILINYDKLRYHLLPYIYSVSWKVTSEGYTMMRPLVMDFRTDTNVFGIKDQFMFGPALMACPVTSSGATSRSVYLPAGAAWYDFWTGATNAGGQTITAAAGIETMPIYVRAGSILPYGPDIQYATQSVDPMEIRVYRGANGSFTLYEDENDNYNYESGSYATIPFTWNEATQTLSIGARQGSFPGMLASRTFRIVFVGSGHGVGVENTTVADTVITYNGSAQEVYPGTTLPDVPTGLNATPGNNQVVLTWTAASGASSYKLKRATVSGGPYTTIATVAATGYTDVSATYGASYYYVVSAVNGAGESANSAEASATPANFAPIVEQFVYSSGSGNLPGQNGGSGFGGAWTTAGSVASPGLTNGSLAVAGNAASLVNQTAFRALNSAIDVTNAGPIWISFLIQRSGAGTQWGGVSLFTGATAERFFMGTIGGNYGFVSYSSPGASRFNGPASALGATTLLVYQLQPNGTNVTVNFYANPELGAAPPAVPTDTIAVGNFNFNTLRLGAGGTFQFDEVRIGSSWSSVAP